MPQHGDYDQEKLSGFAVGGWTKGMVRDSWLFTDFDGN